MVEERGRIEGLGVTGRLQKASLRTDVVKELNTLRKVREINWWWKVNALTFNFNNPNLMLCMSVFFNLQFRNYLFYQNLSLI